MAKKKTKVKKETVSFGWAFQPKNAPSAIITGEYMQKLRKQKGEITPQILVKSSKNKKAILHNCFEWNDTIAAEQHRIDQARYILRMIIITVEPKEPLESYQIRAYIPPKEIGQPSNTSYIYIGEVLKTHDYSAAYAKQLLNRLKETTQIIKNFNNAKLSKTFAKVLKAIDDVKI